MKNIKALWERWQQPLKIAVVILPLIYLLVALVAVMASIFRNWWDVGFVGEETLNHLILISITTYLIHVLIETRVLSGGEANVSKNVALPTLATFLLYLVLSKKDREVLPGDLEEEFKTVIMPKFGLRLARFWYWSQVLRSIAPLLTRQLAKFFTFSWLVSRVRSWLP